MICVPGVTRARLVFWDPVTLYKMKHLRWHQGLAAYARSVRQQRMPRFLGIVWAFFSIFLLNVTQPANSVVAQTRGDTVTMRLQWEVAPGVHPTGDLLGEISGLAIDHNDNVYASDFLAITVWIFGSDGSALGRFGREGEGPGEFNAPTGVAIGPNGHLYVRDVVRVSEFGPDPETSLLTLYEGGFHGPAMPDWQSKRATRFRLSGDLLYPKTYATRDGQTVHLFLCYSDNGELIDSVVVPHYQNAPSTAAFFRTSPRGGRILPGLNHVPFAAVPVWDVTSAGTIISGDGLSYDLAETSIDGVVVNRFQRNVSQQRIPSRERSDSLRALRARLDSIPVPLSQVERMPEEVRRLDVPETYPAYMAVYVGADSTVWVRRWSPAATQRSVFDVFSENGVYLQTVVLPRVLAIEPTPVLSLTTIVAVALDPDTDENLILRFHN